MTDDGSTQGILIVEDDMIIAMVLERMVKKLNHTVIDKVITGKEAIECAQEQDPDLILMDIQLKDDIDGIDAMHKIRQTSDVPVIYITGNSDQYNLNRAKKTNFVEDLVKPIRMEDLKESFSKAFSDKSDKKV